MFFNCWAEAKLIAVSKYKYNCSSCICSSYQRQQVHKHTHLRSLIHTLSHIHSPAHTHTKRLSRHSLSAAIIKFDFLNLKTCINYNTKQSHTHTHTLVQREQHTHTCIYISLLVNKEWRQATEPHSFAPHTKNIKEKATARDSQVPRLVAASCYFNVKALLTPNFRQLPLPPFCSTTLGTRHKCRQSAVAVTTREREQRLRECASTDWVTVCASLCVRVCSFE